MSADIAAEPTHPHRADWLPRPLTRRHRRPVLLAVMTVICLAVQLVLIPVSRADNFRHPADPGIVTAWNSIAVRTIFAENGTPIPSSGLYFGFVSIAVFDAVVTIEGGYRPYAYHRRAPSHASTEVAAATAAYRVLRNYFPSSAGNLDRDYAAFLSTAPNGSAKIGGKLVGEGAAAAIIRLRAADGRNGTAVLAGGTEPGAWRPTPPGLLPMLVPWLGFVKPLVLRRVEQIRLSGPDAIDSAAYARDWAEVKAYGAKNGSSRSAQQTETALFWNANSVAQYQLALADRVTRRGLDIAASARSFALLGTATGDAMIACWRAKYDYSSWRPITAITLADTDGNPATEPDPSWLPLVDTPPYPEYPSGHACITGAAAATLGYLFGADSIDLDVQSSVTGTRRHFATTRELNEETMNARIWLGLHFRKAMTDGNGIGREASYRTAAKFFQSSCGSGAPVGQPSKTCQSCPIAK
jgi:hypothetical protein